ncbi:MAG: copper ion binding protein, partial [Halovenus sp.]
MSSRTTQLRIRGMSCANCAGTIQDAVGDLDGVSEVSANYATDEGSVEYDPDVVSLGDIYDAIENEGYEAASETVTIGITDMSCANCAETSEASLERTPGVIEADVNFATDEAQVRYNPADVEMADLYAAIEDAGYTPVREDDGEDLSSQERQDIARNEEIRHQRNLTLFGAALSVPLLVMMADHLFGLGLVPETVAGIDSGWLAFLFATPVQMALGRPFYENSYDALVKNRTANMDVLIALGSTTA